MHAVPPRHLRELNRNSTVLRMQRRSLRSWTCSCPGTKPNVYHAGEWLTETRAVWVRAGIVLGQLGAGMRPVPIGVQVRHPAASAAIAGILRSIAERIVRVRLRHSCSILPGGEVRRLTMQQEPDWFPVQRVSCRTRVRYERWLRPLLFGRCGDSAPHNCGGCFIADVGALRFGNAP